MALLIVVTLPMVSSFFSSEPSHKGNDFSSQLHHSNKPHREKKIDVLTKSRQKVSKWEFLNSLPLSLRIARTTSSFLSFFNLKIRSKTKPNVSPLSAKKDPRIARIVDHDHKDIPFPTRWAHTSWTNQVHMEQLAWPLCHNGCQRRVRGGGHLAMPTWSTYLLTVYFGTPNMFITLWFGFVYGTNPPLGTLII
jgi:hypothetical protein